ncbi:MAG TPA: ABC transporter substrate-binding protein [Candidatus Binatia bacterium]|jgi:NitT/TauT family transport system substrate-binding protein|nr:ABC transporter substrate-binding protein [Candidatus Binatia bacterium]
MKNRIVFVLLILLCSGFFSSSSFGADKVRVGLSALSATSGSLWVAEEKGLFKKHGIDAEVIFIGGGAARVVGSLIAGDIQFATGGGDAVIRAALRGADVVSVASPLTKGLQRVMARPEIKSMEDLRGKKIGITRFGSASHLVILLALRRWGMRPEEVQILQVESSPAMLASLDHRGIDAAVLTMPSFFLAEERGYRVLADLGEMDIYYLQNTLDTTRSYVRKHRDQALRFTKAMVEGIAYFKKNKKESLEVLQKKLRIQSEQEKNIKYLESSYQLLASKYYSEVPYPSTKAIQTSLEFLAADEPKARGADPKSFMDESLIKELDASGFIKTLYGK